MGPGDVAALAGHGIVKLIHEHAVGFVVPLCKLMIDPEQFNRGLNDITLCI